LPAPLHEVSDFIAGLTPILLSDSEELVNDFPEKYSEQLMDASPNAEVIIPSFLISWN
jgi:hypothetical protein